MGCFLSCVGLAHLHGSIAVLTAGYPVDRRLETAGSRQGTACMSVQARRRFASARTIRHVALKVEAWFHCDVENRHRFQRGVASDAASRKGYDT